MGMTADQLRRMWVDWATNAFAQAQDDYEEFENYYVGDHNLAFATDRWEDTFGEEFEEFADNWCQVVVDALADRMHVTGWDTQDDQELIDATEEIWDFNNLETEELDLYTSTLTKGDGFLIVWPNPDTDGEVDIFFNDALNCNVVYDPENKRVVARAAKHWEDTDGQHHLRLYFPNRTEQYIVPTQTNQALLSGFQVPDDNLPSGWQREGADIPNPYNVVPVIHFRNKRTNSTHGLSEIKSVIPIQNAINKLLMDLMVGSEFGSFRQKYMTGAGHPPEGWKAGTGRVWASTDPNARFGEFGQIDLEPITRAVESLIGHVAKITQTPMHYLRPSGDMPSGEALKTAEAGLIKKAENRSKSWGASWRQAMNLALWMKTGKEPTVPVKPIWDRFEIRHDLEQAQTAQVKALLGVPIEVLWKEHFGATDEQIEQWKKINKDIVASILAAAAAQTGQAPPGTPNDAGGASITQVLALAGKGVTSKTAAGEATPSPQPNTRPPASPTRRSSGFKD